MESKKKRQPLTRQECYEKLCRKYCQTHWSVMFGFFSVVLTALSAGIIAWAFSEWSNHILKNLKIIMLLGIVLVLTGTLIACFGKQLRDRAKVKRGAFLVIEDELLRVEENVYDWSDRGYMRGTRATMFRHRETHFADLLTFSKTGKYMKHYSQNIGFGGGVLVDIQRTDYYTCGRQFYVVVLKGAEKKPVLIYNAQDYEYKDPLDTL